LTPCYAVAFDHEKRRQQQYAVSGNGEKPEGDRLEFLYRGQVGFYTTSF